MNLAKALILAGLFFILLSYMGPQNKNEPKEISFSNFVSLVQLNDIKDVTFRPDGNIHGSLNSGGKYTTFGDVNNPKIFEILQNNHIIPNYEKNNDNKFIGNLVLTFLPLIIFIGFFYYMSKNMANGKQNTFGKSSARLHTKVETLFNDVAGAEEAKEELKEIIDFLTDPIHFIQVGSRIPKGVLLAGPPGTGKTLLAKAVAGEAHVPFFSISGSEFVEMFVGVGASRVRDLFEQAKKHSPCIVFIDEIDAVGRSRGKGIGGGNDEREQTLNQLLVEMDGFNTNSGIIVIAATNRIDVLDTALLRPGRFDRHITVGNPDVKAREAILKVHTRNIPIDSSVDLKVIARGTPGFSGADLENLVNEATIFAAREKKKVVNMNEFEKSKDKLLMGSERKSMVISEEDRRVTSFHEIGHVLVNRLIPGLDPIHKVTIIPHGQALGLTQTLPEVDELTISKDKVKGNLAFLMGGRAAELLMFNHYTTGASNDILKATELARRAITEWGMGTFGAINLTSDNLSEGTKRDVDSEVQEIVNEAHHYALKLLHDNKEMLVKLSEELLVKETLNSEEINVIMKG